MVQHKSITSLKQGETGTIIGYGSDSIPIKVYEMGLLPGVVLTMKRLLPFNGPVCVRIKDNPNAIALRRSEADLILIESLSI
ncbi:FeoA family protein [Parapedobacter tibetensis]|uniref:FeoA family protein n=1 Tax=Parapedobacter tibetensis TaxID=2972951 RepID=UPI00214DBA78|nr:FeoA family protein [Parapedobacter tibetensis]